MISRIFSIRDKIVIKLRRIFSKNQNLLKIYDKIINFLARYEIQFKKLLKSKIENILFQINFRYKNFFLKQSIAKLLAAQIGHGEFNRLDVVVRYLAIENIYGKNDFGLELYNKMQNKRKPNKKYIDWEENFNNLIESVESFGFDSNKYIEIDQNQKLLDGSHRLACALYFKENDIPIRLSKRKKRVIYSRTWFKNNGFTTEELDIIKKKKVEIFKEYGLYFVAILWPPIYKYFNDIQEQLSRQYNIVESIEFTLDKNFKKTIRQIYDIDDIAKWKIEKKIEYMLNYNNSVRFIFFEIPDPKFRKKKNNNDISTVVENLKKKFREFYAKKLENYFYDIIIHISDNFRHSKNIAKIVTELNDESVN